MNHDIILDCLSNYIILYHFILYILYLDITLYYIIPAMDQRATRLLLGKYNSE